MRMRYFMWIRYPERNQEQEFIGQLADYSHTRILAHELTMQAVEHIFVIVHDSFTHAEKYYDSHEY